MTADARFQGVHPKSSFGFGGRFSGPVTLGTWFQGRRQNSSFSCFLAIFVGYSTLFWVPGAIFVARDPRFTVSGPTSKLVIFAFLAGSVAYSTLFWVSETIFVASDRWCTLLGRTKKLVVFGPFWVPGAIFGAHDARSTVSGPTSKLVVFAFSSRFCGHTLLGAGDDFRGP